MMGATVAGFGGVVEMERREGREEMGRCGQMNCREVRASRGGDWVMRFIVEDVVEEVKFGSCHGLFVRYSEVCLLCLLSHEPFPSRESTLKTSCGYVDL
jgi:hypothetical protein